MHNTTGGAAIAAFGSAPVPMVEGIMTAAAYGALTGHGAQHKDFTVNSRLSPRVVTFVAAEISPLFDCDVVVHMGAWILHTVFAGRTYTLDLKWNGVRFVADRVTVVGDTEEPANDIPDFMKDLPVELD
jgi:hypothetical protein